MADDDDRTVINFHTGAPSARMRQFEPNDRRRSCRHNAIEVWPKEPIIECISCGAVVDPYYWIRERCSDWQRAQEAVDWRLREAKEELAELKDAIRLLRREYADEAEKRRAESHLMILPPRRRV